MLFRQSETRPSCRHQIWDTPSPAKTGLTALNDSHPTSFDSLVSTSDYKSLQKKQSKTKFTNRSAVMELSPEGIPILDISPAINGHSNAQLANLANHLANACQSMGCFYIKNHGVDQGVIDDICRDMRSFFTQPLQYKNKYQNTEIAWTGTGYYPFESINTSASMGRMNQPYDPYEKFIFGPSKCKYPTPPNLYPDYPPTLKESVDKYYDNLRNVSMVMMRIMSLAINAPHPQFFYDKSCHAPHILVANYFPKFTRTNPNLDHWMPTHVDAEPLAILTLDPSFPKSLRAKTAEGKWIFADPIPGTFFVNVGRPLQRWTNDKWLAPEHGVVWPENGARKDRLSLAFFVEFHPDTIIECLPSCGIAKYETKTFEEVLGEFTYKNQGM